MVEFKTTNTYFRQMQADLKSDLSILTDFNTGSILNGLLFAYANSLGGMDATLQDVYNASLLFRAEGQDLDNKVADYGLSRKIGSFASGTVTFYKESPPTFDIFIPNGTTVRTASTTDSQGIEFHTSEDKILSKELTDEELLYYSTISLYELSTKIIHDITTVTGTASGFSCVFIKDVDYKLNTTDDQYQSKLEWLTGGKKPDDNTLFYVTYVPLSVDVPIECQKIGTVGNVLYQSIVNIVNTPAGLEKVINLLPTSGGNNTETDTELRTRVLTYLTSLRLGTKNALKAAALSVPGVKNATVKEPNIFNGYVTIVIDDGSGGATNSLIRSVKDMINGTTDGVENTSLEGIRSAGIGVNVVAPAVKYIDIRIKIYGKSNQTSDTLKENITIALTNYFNSLNSGDSVLRAKIIDYVMDVDGVINMDLSNLYINNSLTADISTEQFEVARAGTITVTTVI